MTDKSTETMQGPTEKPGFYDRWYAAGGPNLGNGITFPEALAWLAEENAALRERVKKLEEKSDD